MKPPYITAWTGEGGHVVRPEPLLAGRPALFERHGAAGGGAPLWGRISEARQRECVVRRLCQICARPIKHRGFALVLTHEETLEGLVLTEPLVCSGCLLMALRCPVVRDAIATDGVVALDVAEYEVGAVIYQLQAPESDNDRSVNAALLEAGVVEAIGLVQIILTGDEPQLTVAELLEAALWPHTATLPGEVAEQPVLKEYRWRFGEGVDAHDQPYIVAQHRQASDGRWRNVRSPDRLAQLRALTP